MEINKCRLCGHSNLREILDLGFQKYTGVFPQGDSSDIGGGVLKLLKCTDDDGCGLVQLAESFDPGEMYGDNYGYHSSLNSSMVLHLKEISGEIVEKVDINDDDVILDIGSNDGTLLGTYIDMGIKALLVGIDPSAGKFRKYYKPGIKLVEDFFSASKFQSVAGEKKAKIVTSIAMFYDLEEPVSFASDVNSILADDGVWVMEQSYLPMMVDTKSYDTVCHEHIEFYTLRQIRYIADKVGLRIIDVSKNETNGGSFRVMLAKKGSKYKENESVAILEKWEYDNKIDDADYFDEFKRGIETHREELISFLQKQKQDGKLVLGYGASTKGNVVLQYCGITKDLVPAIVEVNPDKYGCVTPGTDIPILSEEEGKNMMPDYFLVLPWHFKNNILEKEYEYRQKSGVKFVFYLPKFEIV